jgi:hypothetical protein
MPVGKPDAGNQHVRFDERGRETERGSSEHSHRARPRLYPIVTLPSQRPSEESYNVILAAVLERGLRYRGSRPA